MESTLTKNGPMPAKYFLLATLGLAAVAAIGAFTTPYMGAATLAYFLIIAGFVVRKQNSKMHAAFMGSGIVLDLGLVLVLEAQRSAIATAMGDKMNLLQQAHVGFSIVAVVCYIPLIILGFKMLKGDTQNKSMHKWVGICAFVARTAGFLLMFSLLDRVAAS